MPSDPSEVNYNKGHYGRKFYEESQYLKDKWFDNRYIMLRSSRPSSAYPKADKDAVFHFAWRKTMEDKELREEVRFFGHLTPEHLALAELELQHVLKTHNHMECWQATMRVDESILIYVIFNNAETFFPLNVYTRENLSLPPCCWDKPTAKYFTRRSNALYSIQLDYGQMHELCMRPL